ncbi:hypothetical protein BH09PAT1_BH09PAT1_2730 [soil metagenome]
MNRKVVGLIITVIALMLIIGYCGVARAPAQIIPQNRDKVLDRIYNLRGDGLTDDTDALNAWGSGERVTYRGKILGDRLQNGRFLITWRINFKRPNSTVRFNTFVRRYMGFDSLDILKFGRKVRHYNNEIVDEMPFIDRRRRVIRNKTVHIPIVVDTWGIKRKNKATHKISKSQTRS